MTNFENFYNDLVDLAKKYELQNTPLKIENDLAKEIHTDLTKGLNISTISISSSISETES